MSEQHAAFTVSIPENYDRYLVPALFEPYATGLVARLHVPHDASVVAEAVAAHCGDKPVRGSMQAFVCTATR